MSLGLRFACTDDRTANNRINWYFVPRDTPRYNDWYVFHPKVDERPATISRLYEIEGPTNHIRRDNDGFDSWGKSRLHVDGDSDDFLGLSPSDKYAFEDLPPTDPCRGIEHYRLKFGIGFRSPSPAGIETTHLGRAIGFKVSNVVELVKFGVACGLSVRDDFEPVKLGVACGITVRDVVERLQLGLGVGLRAFDPGEPLLLFGLGIGFTASEPTAGVELVKAALAIGFETPESVESLALGIAFGFVSAEADEAVKFGVALGFILYFDTEEDNVTGEIVAYAGSGTPSGYLLCDGSAVNRVTYAALFAAVSTAWGAGDGVTTFNLPDMRDRTPIGESAGALGSDRPTARTLGASGGEETHTLTKPELPAHGHNTLATDVVSGSGGMPYSTSGVALGGAVASTSNSTANAGSNVPHNNMQPFAVLRWLIKT